MLLSVLLSPLVSVIYVAAKATLLYSLGVGNSGPGKNGPGKNGPVERVG